MDSRARFETLTLPHLGAAYRLARWLSGSKEDAEDIVQEAYLKAFRAFDAHRPETVRPWVMAIVRNCWKDHRAAAARRPVSIEGRLEAPVFDGPSPEAQSIWASERQRLDRMLALLPAEFREVLVLRELEDFSYREIAEAIGAPIGTVMSRLARARTLLKDKWSREEAA
jgi:RNA polymerase sigma-70 factor (ECF subfamily)